jgi:hypothetical protein
MPLPDSHIESLERHLSIHQEDIADLRRTLRTLSREIRLRETGQGRDPNPKPEGIPGLIAQRELVERELRTHEALLALGRDGRMIDTLGEFLENSGLAREAARDPKAFAEGRGVAIPADMTIELDVDEADRVTMRVAYYDEDSPFTLTWSRDGFSPPQLSQPQPELANKETPG